MSTYKELMLKAEKFLAEAEEVRLKELQAVLADIKEKIAEYGLTANDLGLNPSRGQKKSAGRRPAVKSQKTTFIKFRGPNGETWSGGRGRKPNWVAEILAAGKSLDDFAVAKRGQR